MKKILNAITAVAAVMALAGCSTALVEKNDADVGITKDYVESTLKTTHTDSDDSGSLNRVALSLTSGPTVVTNNTTAKVTSATSVTYKFQFSLDLADSAASAVKIVTLSGSSLTALYTETPMAVTPTVLDDAIYVTVDPTSYSLAAVTIDPTTFVAKNGQKLDLDNDGVQGEAKDDFYISYFPTGTKTETTSILGLLREPRNAISISKPTSTDNKVWTVTATSGDDLGLKDKYVLQYFDKTSKTWTAQSVTGVYKQDVKDEPATIGASTYTWTLSSAIPEGTIYRWVLTGVKDIASTTEYRGFTRKATFSAKADNVTSTTPAYVAYGSYADSKYYASYASNQNFLKVVPTIDANGYLTDFTVNLNAYTQILPAGTTVTTTPVFKGVNKVTDYLVWKTSGYKDITVANWKDDTNYGADNKANLGTDNEYVGVYKYVLKTPVYVGTTVNVYAKPDLSAVFSNGSSYKIGNVNDTATNVLNPYTEGMVKVN